MKYCALTCRIPSHGVGKSSDTCAEIYSDDLFVLVPPNKVLISLVYSYTYFVVFRYANFLPAERNKYAYIVLTNIIKHKIIVSGTKNLSLLSFQQKSNTCTYKSER